MNHVTKRYIEGCRRPDSALGGAVVDADLPDSFRAYWGDRLLSRPFFASDAELEGFAEDLIGLLDLLGSLPDRLFDGDVLRYCEVLGIDRRIALLLRDFRHGPPTRYGRADLYHDGNSFKILEFNVASDLGGCDRSELERCLWQVDAFRRFASEHRLRNVHTGEQIARALRAAAPCADPMVAVICADNTLARYRGMLNSIADMLRWAGLRMMVGGLSGVRGRGGKLYLDGSRVDVVLRYFTIDDVFGVEQFVMPILRAHQAGAATLWTTMDSSLYSNKGSLTLLSDPRWQDTFSESERRLVDRVLPWSRQLVPDLVEQCVEEREQLILKPPRDFGGVGIIAGWESSAAAWRSALDASARQHCVIQRRVTPAAEPVIDPVTGATEDWIAAWGMHVTPDGYAGTQIRALPVNTGAVISRALNPATRVACVFTYPSWGRAGAGQVAAVQTRSGASRR